MTTSAGLPAGAARKDKVAIVGFASTWTETPWDDPTYERWGLNRLHALTGERPWDRWFQLHDIGEHHKGDDEHIQWLVNSGIPVYMWAKHVAKYRLPNTVPYPKDLIVNRFGPYFTNSISWMIALAIAEGFKHIGIYGVDMAQDGLVGAEYSHQRPSCEWLIGWAQGAGISVYVPPASDLMKTAWLYGAEEGPVLRKKLEARINELQGRKQQHDQQVSAHQQASLQLQGAIEDAAYILRTWTNPLVSAQEGAA